MIHRSRILPQRQALFALKYLLTDDVGTVRILPLFPQNLLETSILKTVLAISRQSFRFLALFGGILALIALLWPKFQALWISLNKGDPVLELFATLLVLIFLVGVLALLVVYTRPVRQRS